METKPEGYNVERAKLSQLSCRQLVDVLEKLLEALDVEVWTDKTPDYTEIILTRKRLGSPLVTIPYFTTKT